MAQCPSCKARLQGDEVFCPNCRNRLRCWKCSAALAPASLFCTACGASQSKPAGAGTSIGTAGRIAGIAAVLAVALVGGRSIHQWIGGGLLSLGTDPPVAMALSDDQKLLRAAAGTPAQFSLLQASGTDGNVRVETWSYPSQGADFLFANGQYVAARKTSVAKDLSTTTTMPEGLPQKASRSQVAKLMEAAPDLTVPIPEELAPSGTVDVYGRGLVAAFVDDELVAANTLPSNAQKTGARTPIANIKLAEFLLNEELARRGRQLARLQPLVPSAQAAGAGLLGRLAHGTPYMFGAYVFTQAMTICLAKDPCSAATAEWKQVKDQTTETLDKLIEEGRAKSVDTNDLEKIKAEMSGRLDERLFEKINELKKERKKGFVAGILVVGAEGVLAMTGWGAALSVAGHIGLSAGAVGLDFLLDRAIATPDTDLNTFIASDLVPTLLKAPPAVQKSLATKLLQIAVQTQCGGYTDPDCAAMSAEELLLRVNVIDKTLMQSLKDSWCQTASRRYFLAQCDHPPLIGTVWTLRSTDKMFNATVDFYGGGGSSPSVIEISTSESGVGCNMPVANLAYDKNKLGFTCGNVAISATLDLNDLRKWTGIVVVRGNTTYQFEGERAQ